MPTFLVTERLALRPFSEADVDRLLDLDNDPEVMRFINGGRPTAGSGPCRVAAAVSSSLSVS